jgi:hypothetical protein
VENKQFVFNFLDDSSNYSIDWEYDEFIDEKFEVCVENNFPVVYANKQAFLALAKVFIRLAMGDFPKGLDLPIRKNFLGDEPEIIRIILEPTQIKE